MKHYRIGLVLMICTMLWVPARPAAAANECIDPNVLVLFDYSGSLLSGNQYQDAIDSLKSLATDYQSQIRFGLMLFPYLTDAAGTNKTYKCTFSTELTVPLALNNLSAISSFFTKFGAPKGTYDTPMLQAFQVVTNSSFSDGTKLGQIKDPGRRNYVILFTDGVQDCCWDELNGTQYGVTGSFSYYDSTDQWVTKDHQLDCNPDKKYYESDYLIQDELDLNRQQIASYVTALKNQGILTFVVGLGTRTDPITLNLLAKKGGTERYAGCVNDCYYQVANKTQLTEAFKDIARIVKTEVCDGIDNNCDGKIDENLTRNCSTKCGGGTETCNMGKWEGCNAPQPQPEVCDGIDNNCDGKIDENLTRSCSTKCGTGVETCNNGKWVGCTARQPEPEKCGDGIDNNCDGKIDEGCTCTPGAKQNCKGTISGACTEGEQVCDQQGQWGPCSKDGNVLAPPQEEICDGKDNDCDGVVDNIERDCSTACGSGKQVCKQGNWEECSAPKPEPEICDGKDNDCDGKIDEDLTRACKTKCGEGVETCVDGKWVNCTAPQPQPEICDGKDNDCNGIVDDNLVTQCSTNCGVGLQTCDNGVPSDCSSVQPVKEVCDGLDNDCNGKVDDGDLCGPGSICFCGSCSTVAVNGECFGNRKPFGGYCVIDNCPVGTICTDNGDCEPHDGPIDNPNGNDVDAGDKGNDSITPDGNNGLDTADPNTGGNDGGSEAGNKCGCRTIQSNSALPTSTGFGLLGFFLLLGLLRRRMKQL
ncbi:MAG: VWA domain-containing protein [Myxococcales bacterium]|nr:VWA domain-containing protein [Myxococcales bacterium]